jgi:membrane-bound ClpP family serine protease
LRWPRAEPDGSAYADCTDLLVHQLRGETVSREAQVKTIILLAALIALMLPAHAVNIRLRHADTDYNYYLVDLDGEIDVYDYNKFWNAVRAIPPGKAMVILNSPGGNVQAGISIGYFIHSNGFMTAVDNGGICASMCAAIWLAGERRFIQTGAFLGFHSTGLLGERRAGQPNTAGILSKHRSPQRYDRCSVVL